MTGAQQHLKKQVQVWKMLDIFAELIALEMHLVQLEKTH